MKNVKVSDTRNFAIVGHSADGKTSLGEALLHKSGARPTLGSVADGSSVLNFLPEEKERILEGGVDYYLSKPLGLADLKEILNTVADKVARI